MNLVLWRHADAAPGSPDEARPLTETGRQQARAVASWLRAHVPGPYRIVGSPALRARDTAAALATEYVPVAGLGYGVDTATGQAVLDAAGWPNGSGTVIFVGHQPTVGKAAALLLTGSDGRCEVFGGSAWWFSNEVQKFENLTLLRAVASPDLVG
jgi:phosphohistidine phosphatase